MRTANEADPRLPADPDGAADPTPLPGSIPPVVGGDRPACAAAGPSAVAVLEWVSKAAPGAWFPSAHARDAGVPRDALDEPLNELRLAGLVRVTSWVKGTGQGYGLTPAGETCAADPTVLAKYAAGPPDLPPPRFDGPPTPSPARPRPVPLDLRPPAVTPALLVANAVWFVFGAAFTWRHNLPLDRYLSGAADGRILHRLGAIEASDLLAGDWWRLVTNCFVHLGLVHLVANLFALGMTGSLAEALWGRWRLLVLYLIAGLGGSCAAMALRPEANGLPVVLAGASGALWGVFTSLVAWLMLFRDQLPAAVVADWSRRLTLMLALNGAVSFLPGVSWAAHLGGGVAGFLAAGLLNAVRVGDRPRRRAAVALLVILPALMVGGLALVMAESETWAGPRAAATQRADRDQREREQKLTAEANRRLAVLLPPIRPAVIEFTCGTAAVRPSPAVRAEVESLRKAVVAAEAYLVSPPDGAFAIEPVFENTLKYVQNQRTVLDLVARRLDAPAAVGGPTWAEIGARLGQGKRLWEAAGRGR